MEAPRPTGPQPGAEPLVPTHRDQVVTPAREGWHGIFKRAEVTKRVALRPEERTDAAKGVFQQAEQAEAGIAQTLAEARAKKVAAADVLVKPEPARAASEELRQRAEADAGLKALTEEVRVQLAEKVVRGENVPVMDVFYNSDGSAQIVLGEGDYGITLDADGARGGIQVGPEGAAFSTINYKPGTVEGTVTIQYYSNGVLKSAENVTPAAVSKLLSRASAERVYAARETVVVDGREMGITKFSTTAPTKAEVQPEPASLEALAENAVVQQGEQRPYSEQEIQIIQRRAKLLTENPILLPNQIPTEFIDGDSRGLPLAEGSVTFKEQPAIQVEQRIHANRIAAKHLAGSGELPSDSQLKSLGIDGEALIVNDGLGDDVLDQVLKIRQDMTPEERRKDQAAVNSARESVKALIRGDKQDADLGPEKVKLMDKIATEAVPFTQAEINDALTGRLAAFTGAITEGHIKPESVETRRSLADELTAVGRTAEAGLVMAIPVEQPIAVETPRARYEVKGPAIDRVIEIANSDANTSAVLAAAREMIGDGATMDEIMEIAGYVDRLRERQREVTTHTA